jgi:hypothetical protein
LLPFLKTENANFQLCLCQDLKSERFYKPQDLKVFKLLPMKP